MKKLDRLKKKLKDLLGDNDFDDFFEILGNSTIGSKDIYDEYTLLKAQFKRLTKDIFLGIIPQDNIPIELNKLIFKFIKLVDNLKDSDVNLSIERKGKLIYSPVKRTIKITQELKSLSKSKPNNLNIADIWSFSFLSILAVDKNEPFLNKTDYYLKSLLKEKKTLIALLKKGFKLKCVISPPSRYSIRPNFKDVEKAKIRTENLIKLLKKNPDYLKHVEWGISRYDYENRYIIGERAMFLGLRFGAGTGYGVTYITKDDYFITSKRKFYESIFRDRASLTLVRYGNKKTPFWRNHDLNREAVLNCLKKSKKYLYSLEIEKM